jgi:hypothetical protein
MDGKQDNAWGGGNLSKNPHFDERPGRFSAFPLFVRL